VIIATVLLILTAAGVGFLIKTQVTPDIDQGRFVILVHLPAYASLAATSHATQEIEGILLKIPSIQSEVSEIGNYSSQDYFAVLNSSINTARIECQVKDNYNVSSTIQLVRREISTIKPYLAELSASMSVTRPSTTFERILNPEGATSIYRYWEMILKTRHTLRIHFATVT